MIPAPPDEPGTDWLARTHDEIEVELRGLHAHRVALEATLAETQARAADADALRKTWQWSIATFLARLSPRTRRRRRAAIDQARSGNGANSTASSAGPTITSELDIRALPVAFDLIAGDGLTVRKAVGDLGPEALVGGGMQFVLFHGWDTTTQRLIAATAATDFDPDHPGDHTVALARHDRGPGGSAGVANQTVTVPVVGFTAALPSTRTTLKTTSATGGVPTSVTVIIPTRDQPALLREAIATVEAATWGDIELVLVDHGSNEEDALAILASSGHMVVRDEGPFNFPNLIRRGIDASHGEVIVILNNDITAENPDWLPALLDCLAVPGCGVAGTLLTYPNGTIQHCGIALHASGPRHPLQGVPLDRAPIGLTTDVRPWWAVTGACMAFTRLTWDMLGGMEPQFAHNYNDVDFCLRARRAGLETRCTPRVPLVHHESASRGTKWDATAAADWILFRARWRDQLSAGDPYWPPGVDMTTGALS